MPIRKWNEKVSESETPEHESIFPFFAGDRDVIDNL